MPFTLADLPQVPAPVDEAETLEELTHEEIARFAMSFDGYAFYGDHSTAVLEARREEWDEERTLPRDIDALRALLFLAYRSERFVELDDAFTVKDFGGRVVHEADPHKITDARREQERFKYALLARIHELVDG